MKVSALTGKHNYFEDFKVGEILKHARGKTVEPLEQVWITNVTMNTAEAHFNEHLTKGTNYGQRLGFGGVTISMCIGLAAEEPELMAEEIRAMFRPLRASYLSAQ